MMAVFREAVPFVVGVIIILKPWDNDDDMALRIL